MPVGFGHRFFRVLSADSSSLVDFIIFHGCFTEERATIYRRQYNRLVKRSSVRSSPMDSTRSRLFFSLERITIRPSYDRALRTELRKLPRERDEGEGEEERRDPALRALNHRRTSVSLHCADFIDYFTAGNIVNLFIPRRRLRRHRCEVAPIGAPIAPIMRVERYCCHIRLSIQRERSARNTISPSPSPSEFFGGRSLAPSGFPVVPSGVKVARERGQSVVIGSR